MNVNARGAEANNIDAGSVRSESSPRVDQSVTSQASYTRLYALPRYLVRQVGAVLRLRGSRLWLVIYVAGWAIVGAIGLIHFLPYSDAKSPLALLAYFMPLLFGGGVAFRSLVRLKNDLETCGFARSQIDKFRRDRNAYDATSNLANALILSRWIDVKLDHMPTAIRLIQQTCFAASQLRFDPIGVLIGNYYGEITSGSREIRSVQTYGIRFGILLTFIGLMFSFQPLASVMLDTSGISGANSLDQVIGKVVEQLSFAFGSSIAGLSAAVLLQPVGWTVRQREDSVLRIAEDVAGGIYDLYLNAAQKTPLLAGVQALGEAMRRHETELYSQTRVIDGAVQGLVAVVEGQHRSLIDRIAEVSGARDKLVELASEQTAEIGRLREIYSQLGNVEERIAAVLEGGVKNAEKVQQEVFGRLEVMFREMPDVMIAKIRSANSEDQAAIMESVRDSLKQATEGLVGACQVQADTLVHALAEFRKDAVRSGSNNAADGRVVQVLEKSLIKLENTERRRVYFSIMTLAAVAIGTGAYLFPEFISDTLTAMRSFGAKF